MPKLRETPASSPAAVDAGELARFLASAPHDLKGWADDQLALIDSEVAEAPDDAVGVEAFADDFDEPAPDDDAVTPSVSASAASSAAARGTGRRNRSSGPGKVGGISTINLVLVMLLAAAIVIIIQQHGLSNDEVASAHSQTSSSALPSELSTFVQVDEEQVAALKKQIEADPSAIAPRQQLADLLMGAGRYQDAIEQLEQILQLTPDDLDTLLAIGVAEFNLNQDEQAEQYWQRATQVAPDNPAPWFNLGFLFMAMTPPDYAQAEQAWAKVIELDPDSDLAATAKAHLERARAASPTPSTGP